MKKTKIWIEGARPKTLIASIAPIVVGSVIAYDIGHFRFLISLFTVLFALSIQVGTNFANDYFDYLKGADTPERKGPRRLTSSGLITLKTMKRATRMVFIFSAFLGLYLMLAGGLIIVFFVLLAIALGYFYTKGPYSLAYLGLGDFFVLIFFGPIATCGTTYLQTLDISLISFIAGLAPGLLSTAILISNNMRDVNEDRKAQKKTLVVRFGLQFGKKKYAYCMLIPALIPIVLILITFSHFFALISLAYLFFAIPLIRHLFREKEEAHLGFLLPKTSKILAIYTLLFAVGYLIPL